MPRPRAPHDVLTQTASRSPVSSQNVCPEETPVPLKDFAIDEYSASPWIGLHYRHEFMLHHRHELLEHQDLRD